MARSAEETLNEGKSGSAESTGCRPSSRRVWGSWHLDEQALETLLRHLDEDRDRAARKYVRIRAKLIRLFEWRRSAGAQELADETINRVAWRLEEGVEVEESDRFSYFSGTAKMVYKEAVRREQRQRRMLVSWGATQPRTTEDIPEADRRLECLRKCLDELPQEQRELILEYYRDQRLAMIRNRQRLADEQGISANSLRIRAHRVRVRLEECVERCMRDEDDE